MTRDELYTLTFEEIYKQLNDIEERTCENCEHFHTDENLDTHCSRIGWSISMYDFEDLDKEYHGRIYLDEDFGCNKFELKQ